MTVGGESARERRSRLAGYVACVCVVSMMTNSLVPALDTAVPSTIEYVLWYAIMIAAWVAFVFGTAADEAHRVSQFIFPFVEQSPLSDAHRKFIVVSASIMLLFSTVLFVLMVTVEVRGRPFGEPRATSAQ